MGELMLLLLVVSPLIRKERGQVWKCQFWVCRTNVPIRSQHAALFIFLGVDQFMFCGYVRRASNKVALSHWQR